MGEEESILTSLFAKSNLNYRRFNHIKPHVAFYLSSTNFLYDYYTKLISNKNIKKILLLIHAKIASLFKIALLFMPAVVEYDIKNKNLLLLPV